MRLLIFLLNVGICFAFFFGSKQTVAVQGKLICKGSPASGVRIKLYDEGFFGDKKLDQTKTNHNGEFNVSGTKSEFTKIDPKISVFHRCDYFGFCQRKFSIEIPKKFISKGSKAKKIYDIGTINLMNKFMTESIDCLN